MAAPDRPDLPTLALTGAALERMAHWREDPATLDRLRADPETVVLELRGDRLEVTDNSEGRSTLVRRPPRADDASRLAILLGEDPETGRPCVAVVSTEQPPGEGWINLRAAGLTLSPADADLFATTLGIANWHAAQSFCPRCGAPTRPEKAGWIRTCEADATEHYPRTDPAVIVAVTDDDDRMLFGRGIAWPEGQFSMLAGFVEPGESFETAAAREVLEESGVHITDVRYLGSQPWPFPASIMVAMAARARTLETTPAPGEMAEVRWLSRDEYAALLRSGSIRVPGGISVARKMIAQWLGADPSEVAGGAPQLPWQVVKPPGPTAATTE